MEKGLDWLYKLHISVSVTCNKDTYSDVEVYGVIICYLLFFLKPLLL